MAITITWGTIKSLLIFFGPVILPRLYGYYQSLRTARRPDIAMVGPLPRPTARSIQLLIIAAVAHIAVLSSPRLRVDNIFALTQQRLQTPTELLYVRLRDVRGAAGLTAHDEALRAPLTSLEMRCMYAAYGPAAVADCRFCSPTDPHTYLLYILPDILTPHLLNLLVLGLATSSLVPTLLPMRSSPSQSSPADNAPLRARRAAPRWRTVATSVALVLAALDLYVFWSGDPFGNKSARRYVDIVFPYWMMRTFRLMLLTLLDLVVAGLIWLSGTNRAFLVGERSAPERVAETTRKLVAIKTAMATAGIVKSTVVRDAADNKGLLKGHVAGFWANESKVFGEVMQRQEVLAGIEDAVERGRLNLNVIERDAETYTDELFNPMLARQAAMKAAAERTRIEEADEVNQMLDEAEKARRSEAEEKNKVLGLEDDSKIVVVMSGKDKTT